MWGIYPVGDLSCNISGIINRTIAERMTWRRTYASLFHLSRSVVTPLIHLLLQSDCEAFSFRGIKLNDLMPAVFYCSHIYESAFFALVFDFSFPILEAIVQMSAVVAEHW